MARIVDPRFGQALKELREAKGLTQKEVVQRIPTYYSSENTYQRVENGHRCPDRHVVIGILGALELTDVNKINEILEFAGYDGLSEAEEKQIDFEASRTKTRATTPKSHQAMALQWDRLARRRGFLPACLAVTIASFAGAVFFVIQSGLPFWFTVVTVTGYATLYPLSMVLETVYERRRSGLFPVALLIFCLVLLSSSLALSLDARSVRVGSDYGLSLSLLMFVLVAIEQWFIARAMLPARSIVKATFQTHTAQAAHFKNTIYFVGFAVVFWAPPVHCVALLERAFRSGQTAFARDLLTSWIPISEGMICLSPKALVIAFFVLLVVSLVMRTQLLDRLRPSEHLNRDLTLFYLRACLYFGLAALCTSWFAQQTAMLAKALR